MAPPSPETRSGPTGAVLETDQGPGNVLLLHVLLKVTFISSDQTSGAER